MFFNMNLDAYIMFGVEADSEEEALEKARAFAVTFAPYDGSHFQFIHTPEWIERGGPPVTYDPQARFYLEDKDPVICGLCE